MTPRVTASGTLWRYTALDPQSVKRHGELAGATAADVRASLRRIGMQVIDLRPVRSEWPIFTGVQFIQPLIEALQHHLRSRRRAHRAEIYDSLATMLNSGVPLMEAIETCIESGQGASRRSSSRTMLQHLREHLRSGTSGGSLAAAMRDVQGRGRGRGWFDPSEVAMVEAAQHAGNLPQVLAALARRHECAGELNHKLLGALAYPFMVLVVGLSVVVFLSVRTLPQLCKILNDSKVATPGLTTKVMWFGQTLAHHWLEVGIIGLTVLAAIAILPRLAVGWPWASSIARRIRPQVFRTIALGNLAQGLAELVRSGVPMVDALRVLAPTASSADLRQRLLAAAESVERGEDLSGALNDPHWFDAEFRRLLDIGQASGGGELDALLERIGQRYERRAKRLIDRLATMLEPVVILSLAALVGTVVMAAILPLLRLQEVLR